MTARLKIWIIYGISALYIALNTYLLVHEKFWALLVPLALLMLVLYLFSLDKVLLLIVFLTPLAVNLKNEEFGIGISLPTEPMMLGILLIFIIKLFMHNQIDRRLAWHPVSIAIYLSLIWIFLTCFTSEMPLVSAKFLVSRLWFIVPFYFVAVLLFKRFRNIKLFVWLYVIPLVAVILYTLFAHSQYGFDKPSSNMVMKPFYNDHTAYGAAIALFLPLIFTFIWSKLYSRKYRIFSLIVFIILTTGLVFSYSRAAWISVGFAVFVYAIILFRIKFRWLLLTFGILTGFFFMFRFQFVDTLEKNKQDSSTDFLEHVHSMSNISSDASNLERINRWQSAIRLFKERPVFGWGPGTYQFVYAPYQRSKERTIISTNYGDMGNAHSEYIGPMAEMGLIGMLTVLGIVITVVVTALRVYRQSKSKEARQYILAILLGLFTYYVHGLLNNFLDTDKASVPFWGFTAIIVAIDLYHRNKTQEELYISPEEDDDTSGG